MAEFSDEAYRLAGLAVAYMAAAWEPIPCEWSPEEAEMAPRALGAVLDLLELAEATLSERD